MNKGKVAKGLALAVSIATLVGVAGCGSSGGSNKSDSESSKVECSPYKKYGDLSGKKISVYTLWIDQDADAITKVFNQFESCTGAKVEHEGSRDVASQLPVRVKAGSAPDIAAVSQPGMIKTMSATGKVKPVPKDAAENVTKYYSKDWQDYSSVDGKLVAIPLDANVKSFVWYSPKKFKEKGYTVPQTWDEMMDLTKKIAQDTKNDPNTKPWSVGLEGGADSGWPGTDWLEDAVIRFAGGETYSKWASHEIPFNDPQILNAFKEIGKIVKNAAYVNGGFGDVQSIASTAWQDAGNPLVEGTSYMMHMALFYENNYDSSNPDIKIAPDGDAWAFQMPGKDKDTKSMLGGGNFAMAFSDRPEVQQFQAFLASPEFANGYVKFKKSAITPNSGIDTNNLKGLSKLAYSSLTDKGTTFRFDASDLMPSEVGSGSFWKQMISYFAQDKSEQEVLDAIEQSWPKGQ
ncbi:alpha-glucosides-binding periplasmic protein AglE [Bombiscardovia apis]|uniref:Alpha-glucosides-binding periplasmic protein AglE n=1 Tax=Bombiscardovia apis TaxID=2932182 RepID=A0ABM8BEE4_9BIFI|nr:ABC transporter substrate-binding protein [Bombiscardovia apis]BDR55296.1 alpha-glucosides-binding periplasmic protein AglE [Bombiscardovia apis]